MKVTRDNFVDYYKAQNQQNMSCVWVKTPKYLILKNNKKLILNDTEVYMYVNCLLQMDWLLNLDQITHPSTGIKSNQENTKDSHIDKRWKHKQHFILSLRVVVSSESSSGTRGFTLEFVTSLFAAAAPLRHRFNGPSGADWCVINTWIG